MGKTKYGISLTQIAKATGWPYGKYSVAPAHVSRILSGRGCSFVNAAKVARAMGLSLDIFYQRFYAGKFEQAMPKQLAKTEKELVIGGYISKETAASNPPA